MQGSFCERRKGPDRAPKTEDKCRVRQSGPTTGFCQESPHLCASSWRGLDSRKGALQAQPRIEKSLQITIQSIEYRSTTAHLLKEPAEAIHMAGCSAVLQAPTLALSAPSSTNRRRPSSILSTSTPRAPRPVFRGVRCEATKEQQQAKTPDNVSTDAGLLARFGSEDFGTSVGGGSWRRRKCAVQAALCPPAFAQPFHLPAGLYPLQAPAPATPGKNGASPAVKNGASPVAASQKQLQQRQPEYPDRPLTEVDLMALRGRGKHRPHQLEWPQKSGWIEIAW